MEALHIQCALPGRFAALLALTRRRSGCEGYMKIDIFTLAAEKKAKARNQQ
jgi:hypothetical protein